MSNLKWSVVATNRETAPPISFCHVTSVAIFGPFVSRIDVPLILKSEIFLLQICSIPWRMLKLLNIPLWIRFPLLDQRDSVCRQSIDPSVGATVKVQCYNITWSLCSVPVLKCYNMQQWWYRQSVRWSQLDWLIRHSVTVQCALTWHGQTNSLHCRIRNTVVEKYSWEIQQRNAFERYGWEIQLRKTVEKYYWVSLWMQWRVMFRPILCQVASHILISLIILQSCNFT